MSRLQTYSLGALLLTLVAGAISGCAKVANAQEKSVGSSGREEIVLTIFANDFAQVSERRPFELSAGTNRLHVDQVSRSLDPTSTLFNWSDPSVQVVQNTYDLGVGTKEGLMRRYLGQEVELVTYGENGKPGEKRTGRLEMVTENGMVVRTDDKLLVDPPATMIAPVLADVVTMPQLSVGVESPQSGRRELGVTYLTRGLAWSADYVLTLNPKSDALQMECWATVKNETGVSFPAAKVTLMAGSPTRAAKVAPARPMDENESKGKLYQDRDMAGFSPGVEGPMPVAAGELYAYPIGSKVTIEQDQLNRVKMIACDAVTVKKDYSVRLDDYRVYTRSRTPIHATLALAFYNKKESGIGLPLPRGTVRVYEPSAEGPSRYVGASEIPDTAVDGRIDLTLSNVFDVSASPRLVSTQKVDNRRTRNRYEVILSNQKAGPVELRVVKDFGGKWIIEQESDKSVKLNAYTNQWSILIPAKGEHRLTFSVVMGG